MPHRKLKILDLAAHNLGKIDDSLTKILNIITKLILLLFFPILIPENQFSVVSIPFLPTETAVESNTAVQAGIALYYAFPQYIF